MASLAENLRPVWVITAREVRDQFRDWRIVIPIIGLTLLFPGLMNYAAASAARFVQEYGANLLAERFTPFLLMIVGFFPITFSLVIALESFAGETERRSIEPLLSSPLADWQLYLGKLLASLLFPVLASYMGITTYLVGVYRAIGWQATPIFLTQVLLLTTVQALVMVSAAVVVSTQSTSVRAANLLSSFIIIPMALIIQAESVVIFWGNEFVLWMVIVFQSVLAVMLIRTGTAHFSRENLLGRELDVIDFRQAWRVFSQAFLGEAKGLRQWLRLELPQTLRRIAIPFFIMLGLMLVGLWIGADQATKLRLPPELLNLSQLTEIDSGIVSGLRSVGFMSLFGAGYLVFHNSRVVLLATIAGIFSFGVLGALILMLPEVMLGFFAQSAAASGISALTFLAAFTLPHGLFEFPAIALTGAAIFRVGATLITPGNGVSIGESWLRALADWARIILVLVLPLFVVASLLETFVTPYTLVMILGK